MDRARVTQLLHALGAKKIHQQSEWVMASCIFAAHTHAKGTDNNPSFGVSVHDDSLSRCTCFSCGETHTLYDMVLRLRMLERREPSGLDPDWARAMELALQDVEEEEVVEVSDLSYEEATTAAPKAFVAFPEFWLDSFVPAHTHPYLKARGVPVTIAKERDVRMDWQRQRLCFPYRDFGGRLAGMQGRDVTGASDLRYLTYRWQGEQNNQVWMGEDAVDFDAPVVLTEGPIDYLKARLATTNVLASLTSALGRDKLDRLEDAYCLITAYDPGTGGDKARATIAKRFPKKLIQNFIPSEDEGDLGAMGAAAIVERLAPYLQDW